MVSTDTMGFCLIVKEQDFVVLDTETTGLHNSEIVQIAIIDHRGAMLLDTLVMPLNPIPAEATAVHGLTDVAVVDAPPWAEVCVSVVDVIRDKNVIVYNADFDLAVLYSSRKIAGIDYIGWVSIADWYCAMQAFAPIYGDWVPYRNSFRWKKLSEAVAYFGGDDVVGEHNALADCRHTLFVSEQIAALNLHL